MYVAVYDLNHHVILAINYLHIYIYTCIYIHIHVCIHTHVYTQTHGPHICVLIHEDRAHIHIYIDTYIIV